MTYLKIAQGLQRAHKELLRLEEKKYFKKMFELNTEYEEHLLELLNKVDQKKTAEICGCSQPYISSFKNGNKKISLNKKAEMIDKLENYLETKKNTLI